MHHALKQPVVVINRTGAGGAVGMASVAKAPADGYTLLMSLSSISIFRCRTASTASSRRTS